MHREPLLIQKAGEDERTEPFTNHGLSGERKVEKKSQLSTTFMIFAINSYLFSHKAQVVHVFNKKSQSMYVYMMCVVNGLVEDPSGLTLLKILFER